MTNLVENQMTLKFDELNPETIAKLGLSKPRKQTFMAEHERQYAIKVLNVISGLSQKERARVLKRAASMNEV